MTMSPEEMICGYKKLELTISLYFSCDEDYTVEAGLEADVCAR